MPNALRLTIATPSDLLVEADDVVSVRGEDESGGFGVLRGHADFLTVLPASIVRWRGREGQERYCALRDAVMTVREGSLVAIACRQAVLGDALEKLEADVLRLREEQADADRRARVEQTRLHARAVRQLMLYLRPRAGQDAPFLDGEEDGG